MATEGSIFQPMLSGLTFTQCVLLIVIVLAVFFVFLNKHDNLPPGPWAPLPYFGFAPNVAYILYKGEPLYKFLTELGNKYGKFYSFKALGIPFVVLNDYAVIREAFDDTKLNDRGDNETLVNTFSRSLNKLKDIGPFRNFVLASFRRFGIGTSRFEEPLTEESKCLIEELASLEDQPADMTLHFRNAVSNVICKVVFGERYELSDERFHQLSSLTYRYVELEGAGGFEVIVPFNFQSKAKQEMKEVTKKVHAFINNVIESHRKKLDPDNPNDLIDLYLNETRIHESDDPDSFRHPDNMAGLIFVLIIGGMDTTATTLGWATQFLVRNPKVQDRIHREIDAVVGRNRLPKLSDKPNLHYTQAFIAELNRSTSILPLSIFHVAGETTTLRGFTIPKNSILISNLYAVMHSPELWGDPEEFRPERFLDDEGTFRELDEVIPFGLGRRNCIGEALARAELFIFFSHLLHQFRFEKGSEDAPMPTLTPIDGVVVHPEPYKVKVIKRI